MQWLGGGLTRAQAKKQRKQLMSEIEREHRRKDRERLAELRKQIADLKRRRREAMRHAVTRCRQNRLRVQENAKALRKQVMDELRETIRKEKEAARSACAMRKQRIQESAGRETKKVKDLLRAERALQTQLRHADKRLAREEHRRTTARERQQESDDAVRSDLDESMIPLFEKVKQKIKGNDRMSRTDVFLQMVHDSPELLIEAMEELSERELKRLIAEERRLAKTSRRGRKPRATAEELAAVPF